MTTTRTAEERAAELVRRFEREANSRGWKGIPSDAAELLEDMVAELVDDLAAECDRLRRGGV